MIRIARHSRRLAVVFALAACSPPPAPGTPDASGASESPPASAQAARTFVARLPDSLRAVGLRPFGDADRMRWFYVPTDIVPQGRVGLTLSRMNAPQRDAALQLLGTALSSSGYRTAQAIMANEPTLRQIEQEAGTLRPIRDPDRYFVTVFDTSAGAEPWGWRFEGHHLSVNVTGAGTQPPAVAPLFMGANPHRIPSGPRAGARLLAAEEDSARALLGMLTPSQRAKAIVSDTTYGEIRTRNDPRVNPLPQEGIAASEMLPAQQATLRNLLAVYANRIEPASAREQWQRIERAGFGRLRFVWAGSAEVGKAHYYRIHGPTVLVEYDNSQNAANHSHTVWRDLENDFGGDLLRKHYQVHRH